MSAESELNQSTAEATPAPTAEYTPLPERSAYEEKPKKKEYDADQESLKEVAKDLDKARAENRLPQAEAEPIDRSYITARMRSNSHSIKRAPPTVSACSWRATNSARPWRVALKSQCTPRGATPTGGKANASTSRPWAGRVVSPAKSSATLCKRS
jgi:hypothetical protein